MWKVPSCENLEKDDRGTTLARRQIYENTQTGFHIFAKDLLTRLEQLEVN
jgi:hypothetical protein